MPRPRIDIFWRDRVKELVEQNPRLGSRKINEQLEAEATVLKRVDWPSEKTVRNIMKEHRAAPEQERRLYGQVFWPESFGTPELPWESAPAVLEAIRLSEEGRFSSATWTASVTEPYRPTVRTAKWLWRLALAEPDMRARDRLGWARCLADIDASGSPYADRAYREMEGELLHGLSEAQYEGMSEAEYEAAQDKKNREMVGRLLQADIEGYLLRRGRHKEEGTES